jgi:hypothetical protein
MLISEKSHAKAQSRQGSPTSELCALAALREVIPVSEAFRRMLHGFAALTSGQTLVVYAAKHHVW